MTYSDKILMALESATKHLDDSIFALKSGHEDAFSNHVWHVAAELEYALFLLLLTAENEQRAFLSKPNPEPKNLQMEQVILDAKELVGVAQESLKAGDLINAYKSAYLARLHIFKVQESLTKKKREVGKGKK